MCKVLNVTTASGNKGIELYFEGKPSTAILNRLKAAFFRWHNVKKCWYHKDDENARRIAAELGDGATEQTEQTDTQATKKAKAEARRIAPIWERTRTDGLHPYGGGNPLIKQFAEQARKNGDCWDKYAAAWIRKHLRERFPEMKFSVTSGGAGYLLSVNIHILAGPYGKITIPGNPSAYDIRDRHDREEASPALKAVLNYCDKLHDSFDADDGDHYADYGAHHDLYGSAYIDYHYKTIPATAEQLADIAAFEAADKADKERKAAEAEAELIRQEAERKAAAEQADREREIFNKRSAEIYEHITIEDLPEAEQIAFTCLDSASGKQSTLREAVDDIAERAGGDKILTDAIISRKIVFNNAGDYGFFCNNLIEDWDFLKGYGGYASEDVRFKDYNEYMKLTAEQRKTVHTFLRNCIGVYNGGELQFVIDPEGYGYARYVLMATTSTTEQNATDYRNEWKTKSEQLSPFYFPAPISEQLAKANLQAGEQITILKLDGWTCSVGTARGKLIAATPCEYAQYKDAAKIEYIPNGKRNGRYFYIANEKAVIYRGNLPEIPDRLKYTIIDHNGPAVMQRVNFAGEGADEFIKTAIAYYAELGYTPVLDTVQR